MTFIKQFDVKRLAIITINSTQNNTIISARDLNDRIITSSSVGLALKKRRGKKSVASGAQLSSGYVVSKLTSLGYSKIIIQVKGFGRGRESAIYGFSSSTLVIQRVIDVTPKPHNGCRPKKSRRI
jgi:small subunit ribosomal protein S11|uniref:Ribosomal protein S11 n=1 Tax=Telonemida sp. TaxID=2652706 RepID=A0A5P8DJX1_9EUKA|nr:ribosomal protein S11 [Telonemida sp.]